MWGSCFLAPTRRILLRLLLRIRHPIQTYIHLTPASYIHHTSLHDHLTHVSYMIIYTLHVSSTFYISSSQHILITSSSHIYSSHMHIIHRIQRLAASVRHVQYSVQYSEPHRLRLLFAWQTQYSEPLRRAWSPLARGCCLCGRRSTQSL